MIALTICKVVAVKNLPTMLEETRIGWNLKVDGTAKLNLMQDGSCAWTSLEEVKDSALKVHLLGWIR